MAHRKWWIRNVGAHRRAPVSRRLVRPTQPLIYSTILAVHLRVISCPVEYLHYRWREGRRLQGKEEDCKAKGNNDCLGGHDMRKCCLLSNRAIAVPLCQGTNNVRAK
ncbi:MAG: hypothetical protein RIE73_35705 [Coleofasciculus sp. C1-SOL-03]